MKRDLRIFQIEHRDVGLDDAPQTIGVDEVVIPAHETQDRPQADGKDVLATHAAPQGFEPANALDRRMRRVIGAIDCTHAAYSRKVNTVAASFHIKG